MSEKNRTLCPKIRGGERIVGDPYIGRSSRHELLLRRGSSVNHCGDAWQDDRNFSKQSDKSEQGVVSQARCNTNRRASQPLKFPWSSFIELRRQAREQNALRHFLITPFLFLARNTRGTFGPGCQVILSTYCLGILSRCSCFFSFPSELNVNDFGTAYDDEDPSTPAMPTHAAVYSAVACKARRLWLGAWCPSMRLLPVTVGFSECIFLMPL